MAVKRIINGKLYNTETAKCVASFDAEYDERDSFSESLYIKKTGEWFLLTERRPEDLEFVYYGGNCGGQGYDIEPYSENQAKEWLVAYDFVDVYIEYFGEPEE